MNKKADLKKLLIGDIVKINTPSLASEWEDAKKLVGMEGSVQEIRNFTGKNIQFIHLWIRYKGWGFMAGGYYTGKEFELLRRLPKKRRIS